MLKCEEKEQRVAVLEESLAATQREVVELRSCLREVEKSRLEARRELQELRRQVRRHHHDNTGQHWTTPHADFHLFCLSQACKNLTRFCRPNILSPDLSPSP